MDKIGDMIQNGLLNYENVLNLNQKYGGGFVNFGLVGTYGNAESMENPLLVWTLNDYKDKLSEAAQTDDESQKAWDELEKSIVANIARDVIVGIKGNKVDMSVICDFS